MIETAVLAPPAMTEQAYLAFEEQSDVRHEMVNGELIAMPGTLDIHNRISGNIYIALRNELDTGSCATFMENIKVKITHERDYRYPDVFVTCDERDRANGYLKCFPCLVVEVLSDSSRLADKTTKFLDYQKIETLRCYVLVEPEKPIVEVWNRDEAGNWTTETYFGLRDRVHLPAINVTIPMKKIYG
ncbi:MAG: Uma2 family endonuclease [Saprospiraceae bacterium]